MSTLEEDVARNRATRDMLEVIPKSQRTARNWADLAYYADLVQRGELMIAEANERENRPGFLQELEKLINRYSIENGSGTPDFILAQYVVGCLENFALITRRREEWYGREVDEEFGTPARSTKLVGLRDE